ncbi:MAG: polymer-forming cytoskeletal protein [Hyphomicrobiaceae bacterium]|nr:polymer-forming cytoskeletal protein [Hyphomicrobiaceae bacterium]
MAANQGVLIVREDTFISGRIQNCRRIEIFGRVEGDLTAETIFIHEGGRFNGRARLDSADVHGTMQGNVIVRNLINIRSSGSVSGNVQYGQLSMESGGSLSADVRNVPPAIAGDLDLTVYRGRSVAVTVVDLTAVDPDDNARDLTYSVSNATNGFVALIDAPARPVTTFSQADLEADRVTFRHDGTATSRASFDVVVADAAGATSGEPQTVAVTVRSRG